MNGDQLEQYLNRVGLPEAPCADALGLEALQRAHLAAVPFENLDIVAGRVPLALDEESLFDKIVRRRRGGICYEQNLLFAAALHALGFKVTLKGGRHPKYGDDMDHLFLLAQAPDAADGVAGGLQGAGGSLGVDGSPDCETWIADVGFAANFAKPLKLDARSVQDDGIDRYVLEEASEVGEGYLRLMRIPGLAGEAQAEEMFSFGPQEYQPADCRDRCDWFSTASESRFVQGPLVTLQGANGRKTLSGRHFIETRDGRRESRDVASPDEFERYLRDEFDLLAE